MCLSHQPVMINSACQDGMWLVQIRFQYLKAASQPKFTMLVITLDPKCMLSYRSAFSASGVSAKHKIHRACHQPLHRKSYLMPPLNPKFCLMPPLNRNSYLMPPLNHKPYLMPPLNTRSYLTSGMQCRPAVSASREPARHTSSCLSPTLNP